MMTVVTATRALPIVLALVAAMLVGAGLTMIVGAVLIAPAEVGRSTAASAGSRRYVASAFGNSVLVIDTVAVTVVATVPIEHPPVAGPPGGVALAS